MEPLRERDEADTKNPEDRNCGNEDSPPHSERPPQDAPRARRLARPRNFGERCGAHRLGAFVRRREELRNRKQPSFGRDRRPERRRQAGPGDRELPTTDTVSVLLNRGDGSFQAKRDYATGAEPELGRDRRPERRRQAGPGDRERRREHRLRAPEQGRRQLPGQARLRNRTRPLLGRDRRPERRRQARPGDRERRRGEHRLRAPEQGRRQLRRPSATTQPDATLTRSRSAT